MNKTFQSLHIASDIIIASGLYLYFKHQNDALSEKIILLEEKLNKIMDKIDNFDNLQSKTKTEETKIEDETELETFNSSKIEKTFVSYKPEEIQKDIPIFENNELPDPKELEQLLSKSIRSDQFVLKKN